MFHPTGCKGPCPLRNEKSNPEKSRHLPRKAEGGELVQRPDAALPGGWILPSVGALSSPSRKAGKEGSRGAGGEKRRGGPGGTRLASGLALPKPRESQEPSAGDSELLRREAVLPSAHPLYSQWKSRGRQPQSLRAPGLGLFHFFVARQSYGIPSSPQASGRSGSALAREPSATRCVSDRKSVV